MSGLLFNRTNAASMISMMSQEPDSRWGHLAELLKFDILTSGHVSWQLGPDMFAESNTLLTLRGVAIPLHYLYQYNSSSLWNNVSSTYGNMSSYPGSILNAGAFVPETGTEYYSNREVYGIFSWLKATLIYLSDVDTSHNYQVWDGTLTAGVPNYEFVKGFATKWYDKRFSDYTNESSDYGFSPMSYAVIHEAIRSVITAAMIHVGDANVTQGVIATTDAWNSFYSWYLNHPNNLPSAWWQFIVTTATHIIDWIITHYLGATQTDPSVVSAIDFRSSILSAVSPKLTSGVSINQRAPYSSVDYYLNYDAVRVASWASSYDPNNPAYLGGSSKKLKRVNAEVAHYKDQH
jgi:hypothetical protein